jgi:hypothetical protein
MDIGAAIKQNGNDSARRSEHRAVQRGSSPTIAAVDEGWVGIQNLPDAHDLIMLRGLVNRMIDAWRDSSTPLASLLQ